MVPPQDDGAALFEREVKPLLEAKCFACHGPHAERLRGGLMMSSHEALVKGGSSGPALVPGEPGKSLLVELVREEDRDYRMPPDEALAPAEIELLERWITLGAPWPGGEAVLRDTRDIDLAAGREWWSFRPVADPAPPALAAPQLAGAVRNDLDRFVFARLEAAGLRPAPPADARTLVRRLYHDLLGLPPTPDEVRRFLEDPRPDRYERLVDALLERPEYGERQGRAWLDVVRFAQTNGYERDDEKPMAWRYRDWVIDAFNADLPYDRFLELQLAGDELEPGSADALVATGLYRVGAWDSEPDDREQADLDQQDDVLRTIGEGMLGLTIGCARCHDHRTDPLRQQDYYALQAFLRGVTPYRRPKFALDSTLLRPLDATPAKLARREELRGRHKAAARERVDAYVADLRARYLREEGQSAGTAEAAFRPLSREERVSLSDAVNADERLQLYLLETTAAELEDSFEGDLDWALAVGEAGPEPPPTHVLRRGRADAPLGEVQPAFPPVLCASDAAALPGDIAPRADSSGRRSVLAAWIADPANPLTARVMANRVWQGHFGVGLVDTPNDFGETGGRPSHPELLDWLAARFVASGWSLKALHRLILDSYTYRMSSAVDDAAAVQRDPQNRLLWRQNLRRLDAESLRDACLAVAGTLRSERGGRGFFPLLSREVLAGGSKPGLGWELDGPRERHRRAVYTFVKRGQLDPLQEVFDLADPTLPQGRRARTTVASQALTLLNSELAGECARELARRVLREADDDEDGRLVRLARLVYQRDPRPRELELMRDFLAAQARGFALQPAAVRLSARVPDRLEADFLAPLPGEALLAGPERGWEYLRGRWGLPYNYTLQYDRACGPAALRRALELQDGVVVARLRLEPGAPFASLLLRARPAGDEFTGLQVMLDREAGVARLYEHRGEGTEPDLVTETTVDLAGDAERVLRVELDGGRVRAELDGVSLFDAHDVRLRGRGRIGLRTWDAGCELTDLRLGEVRVTAEPAGAPEELALAALALTLLNSNEFLYVD
ncbi:MAG: PSD1 domain-containing protein [Planctomycetes bacterium]|nr:PSD1 domain-containing protein [Planctomycetota bacterium]